MRRYHRTNRKHGSGTLKRVRDVRMGESCDKIHQYIGTSVRRHVPTFSRTHVLSSCAAHSGAMGQRPGESYSLDPTGNYISGYVTISSGYSICTKASQLDSKLVSCWGFLSVFGIVSPWQDFKAIPHYLFFQKRRCPIDVALPWHVHIYIFDGLSNYYRVGPAEKLE